MSTAISKNHVLQQEIQAIFSLPYLHNFHHMAKKQGKLNIQQLLDKVTLDELRYFVFKHAEEDKKFKDKVLLHFAEKDPAMDLSKKLRTMIKAAIRSNSSRGYMDYSQARRFFKEMQPIVANIPEVIEKGNQTALEAVIVLLEEVMPLVTMADDSAGDIGSILEQGIHYLQQLLNKSSQNPLVLQQFFTWAESALLNTLWFDYGDTGSDILDIMAEEALKLPPKRFLGFLDQLQNIHRNDTYQFFTTRILLHKVSFLEKTGQHTLAEELIQKNLAVQEIRAIVVNQAIQSKNFNVAKQLIQEGITQAIQENFAGIVTRWEEKLLEIARLENDIDAIRHFTKKFALNRSFSPVYYQEWKETFVLSDWPAVLEDLINKIIVEENERAKAYKWSTAEDGIYRRLAPIFIQEEQWKRLLDLVPADISFESLLYMHQYLAPRFPEEMLAKYLPLLEKEMEKASDRDRYKRIAEWMLLIKKDITVAKIPVNELAKRMILKYPRRPAMIDEMNQVLSKG